MCKLILDTVVNDDDKYQVGLTKIFLRAGQVGQLRGVGHDHHARHDANAQSLRRRMPRCAGRDDVQPRSRPPVPPRTQKLALLDKLLNDRLRAYAVLLQKNLYMRVVRRRYRKLRASTIIVQKSTGAAEPDAPCWQSLQVGEVSAQWSDRPPLGRCARRGRAC